MKLPPHKPQNFLHLSLVKEELQSGQADSHHDSSFTQLELSHNPQYFLQSRLAADVLQSGREASQYSLFLHSKGPIDRNNQYERSILEYMIHYKLILCILYSYQLPFLTPSIPNLTLDIIFAVCFSISSPFTSPRASKR